MKTEVRKDSLETEEPKLVLSKRTGGDSGKTYVPVRAQRSDHFRSQRRHVLTGR